MTTKGKVVTDKELEKMTEYVSRDLEHFPNQVEFHNVVPYWNREQQWWCFTDNCMAILILSAKEFGLRYGWIPAPGICWEVEWGDIE